MKEVDVSALVPGHLDEAGKPCPQHAAIRPEVMLMLQLVGTRASGFNHDLASKLQGLLMTLEDLVERLAERGEAALHRAASDASAAAQDIAALVTVSRQLTRNPGPMLRSFRELIDAACARAGVTLAAPLPEVEVEVVVPHVTHALALVIEVAGGPARARALDSSCRVIQGRIELTIAAAKQTTSYASEYLAIAAAILRRDHGDVRCGDGRLVILLPRSR